MSAGFTPAPWHLRVHTGTGSEIRPDDDWSVSSERGPSICFEGGRNPNAHHDAHLIAAAPDLYEALKSLLAANAVLHVDSARFDDMMEIASAEKAARAALRKARGEVS